MTATADPTAPLVDLPCRELVELVTEYLEGTLDPLTARRLRAHLAGCDACTDYLDQIRATAGLTAALTDADLPPTVRDRLLAVYRGRRG